MMHKSPRPLIRKVNHKTMFQRRLEGVPLPLADSNPRNICFKLIDDFQRGAVRPEYLVFIDTRPSIDVKVCKQMIERYYDVEDTIVLNDWFRSETIAIDVHRLKKLYVPI